jgi:flagellar biosynthesis protein FliR
MDGPMVTFNEAQIMAWVTPIFWPFLRVLGVFASAPIFSARTVPMRTKIGLAFVIAICLQPSLSGQDMVSLNSPAAFSAVVQQISIGVAIGLAVRIVFAAVEMAGEIIGLQMGLNFAGFFDPSTNAQSSTVGRYFGNMSMLLFLVLNGHLLLIQAVAASFQTFPVGSEAALGAVRSMRLHEAGGIIFYYGLWIALPMIGMLLFINVVMGIISRIAPQMNVFAIGFPMTLSVGLLGIAFTLPMLDRPVMQLMQVMSRLLGVG